MTGIFRTQHCTLTFREDSVCGVNNSGLRCELEFGIAGGTVLGGERVEDFVKGLAVLVGQTRRVRRDE